MAAAIAAWSDERVRQGRAPVSVAIGAHYGMAFAGVLSDGRLLEYTVIGDTVNIASRLADVPRPGRTQIVVSAELVDAAGGLQDAERWTHVPAQALPGHPRLLSAFRRA
jgi:adenylate cyclase